MVTELEKGIALSFSISNVSGLVLARSAFHHSLNYESIVIFGKGELVAETEKEMALKLISDHLIKKRWEEIRAPSQKELKATKVIKITIDQATAKIRTSPPIDDKKDYELNVWAGVLPIVKAYGQPQTDRTGVQNLNLPQSIVDLIKK